MGFVVVKGRKRERGLHVASRSLKLVPLRYGQSPSIIELCQESCGGGKGPKWIGYFTALVWSLEEVVIDCGKNGLHTEKLKSQFGPQLYVSVQGLFQLFHSRERSYSELRSLHVDIVK